MGVRPRGSDYDAPADPRSFPPDVLPHRDLGRPEPAVRSVEVPDLHARGLRDHAALHVHPLLDRECVGERRGVRRQRADARHDRLPARRPAARDRLRDCLPHPRGSDPDLRGLPVRFHREVALRAVPHLAASSLTVIGVQGGIFQLFNHGIITAILFMLAGSVKHSTGTRDIPELQGLARVMPQFSLILAIGFFASLGLPGLNSFWSEFMVFVGAYGSPNLDPNRRLILIPLLSIVVTAAYYLYTMQRILFGDPPEKLAKSHDLLPWERISYAVLVALVFLVGIFPFPFLGMINAYTSASFPWLAGL